MNLIDRVGREHKKQFPDFSSGDTVRVHVRVIEGEKVRTQIFQGMILGRRGSGLSETFTIRKISASVSVERIFPVHSPNVLKIEKIREGKVRRAKLTYMRSLKGKKARLAGRDLSAAEIKAQPDREPAKPAPAPEVAPEATPEPATAE